MGPTTAKQGQGALSLTVDLRLLIARVRKWAFSCIYTDAPQTPTPAPMDSSNAGLIQTALVRLHRYQNKTKRHESGTVTNRVGVGLKGTKRDKKRMGGE